MPLRTVVLRHDRHGAASHFDWLLAVDDPPVRPLLTWRCEDRPDLAAAGEALAAQRIEPHRTAYLEFEGPLSGNRGTVQRIADGVWRPANGESLRAIAYDSALPASASEAAKEGSSAAGETLELEIAWTGSGEKQRWRLSADQVLRLD